MNRKLLPLTTLFCIFSFGIVYSQGDNSPCSESEFGINKPKGIYGFFVRHSVEKTDYLDFNSSSNGCLIKGQITNQNDCVNRKRCEFNLESNLLLIDDSGVVDSFMIESLNCKTLIIRKLAKTTKVSRDTLIYYREINNSCDIGYCHTICPTKVTIDNPTKLKLLLTIIQKKYAVYFAFYVGTFILLFRFYKNKKFILLFIRHWLVLASTISLYIYSSSQEISLVTGLYYFCGASATNFTKIGFYSITDSAIISKLTMQFWFGAFMFSSFFAFPCSIWFSWRRIVRDSYFKNIILNNIFEYIFSPAYVIIVIVPLLLVSMLFLSSLAGWIVVSPKNWMLMFVSIVLFYFYYIRFIFLPFIKTDLKNIIAFFRGGFKYN